VPFLGLAEFCLKHPDYPGHDALERAITDRIDYRNAHRDGRPPTETRFQAKGCPTTH